MTSSNPAEVSLANLGLQPTYDKPTATHVLYTRCIDPDLHGGRIGVPPNLNGQGKLCGEDWQRAQLPRKHKVKQ